MKIVNKPLLHKFIEENPSKSEWLKAWLLKVKQESWDTKDNLLGCFPKAKLKDCDKATFYNIEHAYLLDVSIHYASKIVVIEAISNL
ncbi:MAG: type II toxin-antitoxin system HigB family toxin [Alphaproteobacteria bacterium]|nr:type II toxin-antitoxin system HigB family toxin [Alphaproteobacteria bacterium]